MSPPMALLADQLIEHGFAPFLADQLSHLPAEQLDGPVHLSVVGGGRALQSCPNSDRA
jgi:hypothetical protein